MDKKEVLSMATPPYLALPCGARPKNEALYGIVTIFMLFPRPHDVTRCGSMWAYDMLGEIWLQPPYSAASCSKLI